MDWRERIVIDPEILVGKPIIKGTRIAVPFVVSLVAEGWSREQILKNNSQLEEEDIGAALQYAAEVLKDQQFYPLWV